MNQYEAIVIGTSAGGLDALTTILPALPADRSPPVLIVQHRPDDSDEFLAAHLNDRCDVNVFEAEYGEVPQPGNAYIAPGGYHLHVQPDRSLRLSVDPPVHFCRPSVDVLFFSSAEVYKDRLVGLVLTGANEDGSKGAQEIKRLGGLLLVEQPSTAFAASMPRHAIERVAPDQVLSLERLAQYLENLFTDLTTAPLDCQTTSKHGRT